MAFNVRNGRQGMLQLVISSRRIRSLERHLRGVSPGDPIVIGLTDIDRFNEQLERIGFTADMGQGEMILPIADTGPVSRHNAEGKYKVHYDQPMETAYRTVEWHWMEWHGRYDRVSRSKLIDVPYPRHPRTFIPPPSVELAIARTANGNRILRTPSIEYIDGNEELLLHTINLFLEIFHECSILTGNLEHIIYVPVRRLNWDILPPGRRPWAALKRDIEPIVHEVPKGNQSIVWNRLETVNAYQPEFHAIGRGGFRGYIIFGFPSQNLYVLECIHYGNATYIFNEQWEQLSRLTKSEIIAGNLQTDRIIHSANWEGHLKDTMEQD